MVDTLHIISGLGVGGAETMLAQVAAALHRRGLSQHVVTLTAGGGNLDRLRQNDIAVTELPISNIASAPLVFLRLRRLLGRTQPRNLMGWMYHGNVVAALVHPFSNGRQSRKLTWNVRASNVDMARYGKLLRLQSLMSTWPDMIIANSHAGAMFHIECGVCARRLKVIPNGVDIEKFKPDPVARSEVRSQLGIAPDIPLAIHVARVDPMKNHSGFIAAMEKLRGVAGLMVGAGTAELQFPSNVKALGKRSDVERLYASADIVVSTSAYAEGFSNAIAEGMSVGLTPVVSDVGDARFIVGGTGSVVPPRDGEALLLALGAEASRPAAERQARGLEARARIVEKFSLQRAVDAYEQVCSGTYDSSDAEVRVPALMDK